MKKKGVLRCNLSGRPGEIGGRLTRMDILSKWFWKVLFGFIWLVPGIEAGAKIRGTGNH